MYEREWNQIYIYKKYNIFFVVALPTNLIIYSLVCLMIEKEKNLSCFLL